LCGILGVRASLLFGEEEVLRVALDDKQGEIASIPRNDDRVIIKLLKEQVKDKQLIIDLLVKQLKTSECGGPEINSG